MASSSNIETKIRYFEKVKIKFNGAPFKAFPFVRKDYHEDGSDSTYFGLELEVEQFDKITGKDYTQWETKT